MKAKTTLMIILLAVLSACGTPASGEPAAPSDPIATWTAAVRAEDWDAATAMMAAVVRMWLTRNRSPPSGRPPHAAGFGNHLPGWRLQHGDISANAGKQAPTRA